MAGQHGDGIAPDVRARRVKQRRDDGDEQAVQVDDSAFVFFRPLLPRIRGMMAGPVNIGKNPGKAYLTGRLSTFELLVPTMFTTFVQKYRG